MDCYPVFPTSLGQQCRGWSGFIRAWLTASNQIWVDFYLGFKPSKILWEGVVSRFMRRMLAWWIKTCHVGDTKPVGSLAWWEPIWSLVLLFRALLLCSLFTSARAGHLASRCWAAAAGYTHRVVSSRPTPHTWDTCQHTFHPLNMLRKSENLPHRSRLVTWRINPQGSIAPPTITNSAKQILQRGIGQNWQFIKNTQQRWLGHMQ